MKICFITSTIFNLGGVQRVVSVLASELANYYEVDILCTDDNFKVNRRLYNLKDKVNIIMDSELLKRSLINRIFLKLFNFVNKKFGVFNNKILCTVFAKTYYSKGIRNRFIKSLNSNNYDIVIGVEGYYSLLLGKITDRLKARTIGWQHNSYDAYLKNKDRYYWHQDALFEKYIPKLDRYLVLTDYDRRMFLKNNNIKCVVMHNPRSFNSSEKSNVTKKQFLAAGRFTHQKGFDLLIDSFYKFSQIEHNWILTIVGEGYDKEKNLKLIDAYKLNSRVTVAPFTDNIKEYFLNSSILLLSSRWEGMPMIVLESLEMGVPVIAYDITAVEEIIDNEKEGIIVEKFDTDKFAEAMYKLGNSYEMRCKFSKNAINKSNKFEINRVKNRWLELMKVLEE